MSIVTSFKQFFGIYKYRDNECYYRLKIINSQLDTWKYLEFALWAMTSWGF